MNPHLRPAAAAASVVLALTLAACGGGSDSESQASGAAAQPTPSTTVAAVTTTAAAPASTAPTTAAPAATTTTTAAVVKANANTASRADIQAALESAGVPSAAQWSREVVEYRPYPTNDPNMAKLRQNLAKYNPGPGVVDLIISALSL